MTINYEMEKAYISVYTRKIQEESYPSGLAHSVHLAYSYDGKHYCPMNENYGVLFAKAEINTDNTLSCKSLQEPLIFARKERDFYMAMQVQQDGTGDATSKEAAKFWITKDFINFEERESVPVSKNEQPNNIVTVDRKLCEHAVLHWSRLLPVKVHVPEQITVHSLEELAAVKAEITYTDGSTSCMRVKWELDEIDPNSPGKYYISGQIAEERYPFPLLKDFGDPVVFPWEGRYYFIGTNDNLENEGFYVREADTVAGLFAENVEQHMILGVDEEKELIQTFWAPEFHVIGEELYLLFAVSGKKWGPQCHLMKLKKGGRIIEAQDWEAPVRICKKDGGWLSETGITLDMTYIKAGKSAYYVWSYREHGGTAKDSGSMLYIARVNEQMPWQLESDPVLLSRPLYSWENVGGTINNEGPYAFLANGKVYLTYSGGSCNSYTYAIGLLVASEDADLLDVQMWNKRMAPVLTYYSIEGEYGSGHNSFFVNEDGNLYITYHAEISMDSRIRCAGIHRVHFNIHGEPVFDMAAEREADDKLRNVNIVVDLENR